MSAAFQQQLHQLKVTETGRMMKCTQSVNMKQSQSVESISLQQKITVLPDQRERAQGKLQWKADRLHDALEQYRAD